MQADDKTKGGKSDRNAFCSQIKTKIVQSLLCTCCEKEKLPAGGYHSQHPDRRLCQTSSAPHTNETKTSFTSHV